MPTVQRKILNSAKVGTVSRKDARAYVRAAANGRIVTATEKSKKTGKSSGTRMK